MFQFYHYHAQLYSYSLNPDIPHTFQGHVSCTCTLQTQSVLHLKLYLATVLEQVLCRFELQLVFLFFDFSPGLMVSEYCLTKFAFDDTPESYGISLLLMWEECSRDLQT